MAVFNQNNLIKIIGTVEEELIFDHKLHNEAFYNIMLAVPRLSGINDFLPVTVPERLLNIPLFKGDNLEITGQIRSYNRHNEYGGRLMVTVFAKTIRLLNNDIEPTNQVLINGFLCKEPVHRMTPFSREIADMLVAVNRSFNKSDYLPCIAWGRNARYASTLNVGDRVTLEGRLQSRIYSKENNDGSIDQRTVYEISCSSITRTNN